MIDATEPLLCRGMRDLLPPDMARFRRVQQAFLREASGWGYEEIRTPTLEHLYLFTSSGTLSPQLLGRVYSFLDWDGWTGERVVLRPDATIPVARLYRERLGSGTAKLAYVANIFRFNSGDEPRELWQCGAELIGETWPAGDLELIAFAAGALRAAGLKQLELRLSHTGIVRALLDRAGFGPEAQLELYDRLLDGDTGVMQDLEGRLPALGPALRLIGGAMHGGAGYLDNLAGAFLEQVPGMAPAIDDLRLLMQASAALKLPVRVSLVGAHDFEYYTGPVFELVVGGTTLVRGGRYDGLIGDAAGERVPACGFAMHVEAIMHLLEPPPDGANPVVQVDAADATPAALHYAVGVAADLRDAGLRASLTWTDETDWKLSAREGTLSLRNLRTEAEHDVQDAAAVARVIGRPAEPVN